ncbi:MAG: oligosaccharide flippase family protein [Solirubrobacteraceae bacterium]|nr:oligosaccharide flippase family protein [Solirubrobacteraceae bacterium]
MLGAAGRVLAAGGGAATTVIVARLLGPADTGSFAVAVAGLALLLTFTTLGAEHGVAYYVSRREWSPRNALRVVVRLALATGGVIGAGCTAVVLLLDVRIGGLTAWQLALVAGTLPFVLTWYYASYVAVADERFEVFVIPPALQAVVMLVAVAVLAVPFGLWGVLAGLVLSHAVPATVTLLQAAAQLSRRPEDGAEHGRAFLTRAIGFGIKGYAANALQVLTYRVDIMILAGVASAASVGHYSVATSVTLTLLLLPQALNEMLYPRVAALTAEQSADAAMQRYIVELKTVRHATLVVIAGSALLALALVLLVKPLYGPAFGPAIELGLIRMPGVALLGVAGAMSAAFVGRGYPQYALYGALLVVPVTMGLFGALIPLWGATGAAVAATTSFTLSFLAAAYFYRRVTDHNPLVAMWPTRSELSDYVELVNLLRRRFSRRS